ncbi:hypothetical protein [Embleya sp. NPDC001921]
MPEDLLTVIGHALGIDGPLREFPPPAWWWDGEDRDAATPGPPDGYAIEVMAGVVDRDRVAWVQRHTFPPDEDGDTWVAVWLRLAGDGLTDLPRIQGWVHFDEPHRHIAVPLTNERADYVTGVPYMKFFDDHLVVVTEIAGSRAELCRLTLHAPGLAGVQADHIRLGTSGPGVAVAESGKFCISTTLCHISRSNGQDEMLAHTLSLPDLARGIPIPLPEPDERALVELRSEDDGLRWVERLPHHSVESDTGRSVTRSVPLRLPSAHQRSFVVDPQVLWDRLHEALAAPDVPRDGPDTLIGAVAKPFWDPSPPSAPGPRQPWDFALGPWWFPAAWYRFLRSPTDREGAARPEEAAAWLRWLQRLAGDATLDGDRHGWNREWTTEEGAERFALTHLRRQATILAAACVTDRLPVIGDYHPKLHSALPLTAYPPGFARAWRSLPDRFRPGGSES